jgi:hypothetical protein
MRLIKGDDLTILKGDPQMLLTGGDEKRAGFPTEREHLQRGL